MGISVDTLYKSERTREIFNQPPWSLLSRDETADLFSNSGLVSFKPGQRLARTSEISSNLFLVVEGVTRVLGVSPTTSQQVTLDKPSIGSIVGWVSILRGVPTDFVQASTDVLALSIPSVLFTKYLLENSDFCSHFLGKTSIAEVFTVKNLLLEKSPKRIDALGQDRLIDLLHASRVVSGVESIDSHFNSSSADLLALTSSNGNQKFPPGSIINQSNYLEFTSSSTLKLPPRIIVFEDQIVDKEALTTISSQSVLDTPLPFKDESASACDLESLGILEQDSLDDSSKFPALKAKGASQEVLAVLESFCIYSKVPFRKDSIRKALLDYQQREKTITVELLGALCELLGFSAQLAETSSSYISSIECPALLLLDGIPCILYGCKRQKVILAHPHHGIFTFSIDEISNYFSDRVKFILPKRIKTTPTSRFGWNWFTPLVKKYKTSLILVFIASFLAQLFGLAIPLLLQQIIDKVLSQGNLSSLNFLGGTMVVLALFQGILQALRTYIFVDTTDRMDLTLGSSVIQRLLSLPLSYFERRSVGDLTQRLGELNNIRSFLTGTALISILNILFASLYVIVMFIYSPLLAVVALSTFPVYLALVLVVAPIYKSLIRKRAIAQARTQSHLIEIIGGIQTVKAQNFELTARWKWQDRYRVFVNEGFKSVALGSTASEIGGFLTQVSGLLVLWIGMMLVLKGQFSLGQLIAFRIISGNVTGPLLQLSSLYQGFQSVQLSMDRLRDIVDQAPELSYGDEDNQFSLPPIVGKVKYENVFFRFSNNGPYQLENVSLELPSSSFVGIVGQSGSGKSTLVKLLARLYDPESGRIFIDDYDIAKIDLKSLRRQIGIVPQDSLLFEGTVAENIALNDPQASDEAIIEASKIACCHDFIMNLGQGYATPLAERGSNLSGGQRQRLAIARTILSNPQLLVMDEATSALDYDTERELCLNLQRWAKDRTVLFITHRLATIRNSDLILVMQSGSLQEQGNHDYLMSHNGLYASLFKQQDSVS